MTGRLAASAVVLALVVTAACKQGLNSLEKSPGESLRSFYTACNEGRYSEAEPLLSESLRTLLKSTQAAQRGGLKTVCDRISRNGTLVKVEIVREAIRGEGAVVTANISFKDGTTNQGTQTDLIKEGSSWKIEITNPEQASIRARASNDLEAAKHLLQANPDLEVANSDATAGTVTIRNKKTGETVTLSVEDIKQGRFKMRR